MLPLDSLQRQQCLQRDIETKISYLDFLNCAGFHFRHIFKIFVAFCQQSGTVLPRAICCMLESFHLKRASFEMK